MGDSDPNNLPGLLQMLQLILAGESGTPNTVRSAEAIQELPISQDNAQAGLLAQLQQLLNTQE